MQPCFFEKDEEKNLGEVCEHNLKYHVQVPIKLTVKSLFLFLNVP
jgi:hypothetical protein